MSLSDVMEGSLSRNVFYTLKSFPDRETPRRSRVGLSVVCSVTECHDRNLNERLAAATLASLFYFVVFGNISMLKRSYSMEFDSNNFKLPNIESPDSVAPPYDTEDAQTCKKVCSSPVRSTEEKEDGEGSPDARTATRRQDSFRRYTDNIHVTQSRSIFSHEDGFVYGNPKEMIKTIETVTTAVESAPEVAPDKAMDLSCKALRPEDNKPAAAETNTYHSYHKSNFNETSFARSNLEIKLVNQPAKKPSIPEQLQIAKLQQQQRRSIQQQQKMLQQMRRSLDPSGKSSSSNRSHHHGNNTESSQGSHKPVKYHEDGRIKDEYHFPQPQYPYFDPNHAKELPDGHPILPLLDPVYFSALYNAHGFLPPSSPSIAAAFIGTLQDALPKLPMMFPPASTNANPLHPQKSNDNPN